MREREVVFAGNDVQKTFITAAFPGISCLDLPGYGVKYSAGRFLPNILRQIPKILSRIRAEHRWLLKIVEQKGIDAVISDNRYGLWHPRVPTLILTHQAGIITGLGAAADAVMRRLHYPMLQRFGQTWIVDVAGDPNLAGRLAHPPELPANARYAGWLSQLVPPAGSGPAGHVLILLSGPEPQRTILADMLWQQACEMRGRRFVFVEGRADAVRNAVPMHIRFYPCALTDELPELLGGAGMVVCRSGYSSLMDLALFGKPAVLVPTPGQTEQEYLGRKLHAEGVFMHRPQRGFSLEEALDSAADFPFRALHAGSTHRQFETLLDAFLEQEP